VKRPDVGQREQRQHQQNGSRVAPEGRPGQQDGQGDARADDPPAGERQHQAGHGDRRGGEHHDLHHAPRSHARDQGDRNGHLQAEGEHVGMRERRLGAVGGDDAAGHQLLVTRGGQRDQTHDAAGEPHRAEHSLELLWCSRRDERRDRQEGGPHQDDAQDHEGVLGEGEAEEADQEQREEPAKDRAGSDRPRARRDMERRRRRREQEEKLARGKAEAASHPEAEQLQGDGEQPEVDAHHGLPHDRHHDARRDQRGEGHRRPGGVGEHGPRRRKQGDGGHSRAGSERRLEVHRPASLYVGTDGMVGALPANCESRLNTVKASEGMLPLGGCLTSPKVAVTE
jgi:hypothetical protein